MVLPDGAIWSKYPKVARPLDTMVTTKCCFTLVVTSPKGRTTKGEAKGTPKNCSSHRSISTRAWTSAHSTRSLPSMRRLIDATTWSFHTAVF